MSCRDKRQRQGPSKTCWAPTAAVWLKHSSKQALWVAYWKGSLEKVWLQTHLWFEKWQSLPPIYICKDKRVLCLNEVLSPLCQHEGYGQDLRTDGMFTEHNSVLTNETTTNNEFDDIIKDQLILCKPNHFHNISWNTYLVQQTQKRKLRENKGAFTPGSFRTLVPKMTTDQEERKRG